MKYTYVTVILFCFASYNSAMITQEELEASNKPVSLKELKTLRNSTNSLNGSDQKSAHSSTEFSNKIETPTRSSGESQSPEYNSYRLDRLGKDARKQSFHPSAINIVRDDSDLENKRKLIRDEIEEQYPKQRIYLKFVDFMANETDNLYFDVDQVVQKIQAFENRLNETLSKQRNAENHWQQKALWGGLGASLTLFVVSASNLAATFFTCGE